MATTSYLDRLLDPLTEAFTPKMAAAFTPKMAAAILELRADSELEAASPSYAGKQTMAPSHRWEDAEYKDFVEAVDLISIMQAKARRFLTRPSV